MNAADTFENEVDCIISLCLRYSWSEHEIVKELERLRDRWVKVLKEKP